MVAIAPDMALGDAVIAVMKRGERYTIGDLCNFITFGGRSVSYQAIQAVTPNLQRAGKITCRSLGPDSEDFYFMLA